MESKKVGEEEEGSEETFASPPPLPLPPLLGSNQEGLVPPVYEEEEEEKDEGKGEKESYASSFKRGKVGKVFLGAVGRGEEGRKEMMLSDDSPGG